MQFSSTRAIIEPKQDKINKMTCVPSNAPNHADSDDWSDWVDAQADLICLFDLWFNVPVNNCDHVGMVSYPIHTDPGQAS